MPTGARGHNKIQCYARWHEILVFSWTTASIFMRFWETDQTMKQNLFLNMFTIIDEIQMIF